MKRAWLIGVLFLLAACGDFDGRQTVVETQALDPAAIGSPPVPPPPSFDAGADSNPKLLATYVVTDSNIGTYNYVDENGYSLPSGTTQYEQLSLEVDPAAAALGAYLEAEDNQTQSAPIDESPRLTPQADLTACTSLTDGCFYLVQSKESYQYNAAMMRVYVGSRASGNIVIEEDNFSSCRNNRTNLIEVPYVFLGGKAQGSNSVAQTMDAGLFWNCGLDNWALFAKTSNGRPVAVSGWRLVPGQIIQVVFFVNNNNIPFVEAFGTWRNTGTGRTVRGVLRIACNTTNCRGQGWSYSGFDNLMKVEINLAQGFVSNNTFYRRANFRSGAKFAGTRLANLWLGKLQTTSTGNRWTSSVGWNIGGNPSSSIYTARQCIVPSSGAYGISGVANSPSGATYNLQLPR